MSRARVWRVENVRLAALVATGGAAGASLRWFVGREWPVRAGEVPWSTLAVNVAGCLAIGVLMVVLDEVLAGHPTIRPLLGVGVLGGFTTFSTFAVESHALLGSHRDLALAYLVGTPILAVVAAILGASLAASALRVRASLASRRSTE